MAARHRHQADSVPEGLHINQAPEGPEIHYRRTGYKGIITFLAIWSAAWFAGSGFLFYIRFGPGHSTPEDGQPVTVWLPFFFVVLGLCTTVLAAYLGTWRKIFRLESGRLVMETRFLAMKRRQSFPKESIAGLVQRARPNIDGPELIRLELGEDEKDAVLLLKETPEKVAWVEQELAGWDDGESSKDAAT